MLFGNLETRVIGLLPRTEQGDGVRIFIGSENKLFSMSGSSMVAAPFRDVEQRSFGVVGIIGPTRPNYARIVPMVDYTAKVVGGLLDGGRWRPLPAGRPHALSATSGRQASQTAATWRWSVPQQPPRMWKLGKFRRSAW